MNNTFELFSLKCERDSFYFLFLNELNLSYQRLTSFVASFDFHSNSASALGYVFNVSHSY